LKSRNPLIRGYILIETLVSIAVLSIGLMVVINAFSSIINALRTSRNYTHASILAEEKIYEIKREGLLDVNKWRGKSGSFFDATDSSKSGEERKKFEYKIGAEWPKDKEGNIIPDTDIALLEVAVEWDELRLTRQFELVDYMRSKIHIEPPK
jgi:type II secretory pathway pseudopilin PulG